MSIDEFMQIVERLSNRSVPLLTRSQQPKDWRDGVATHRRP
jgi:hypothetical protein